MHDEVDPHSGTSRYYLSEHERPYNYMIYALPEGRKLATATVCLSSFLRVLW